MDAYPYTLLTPTQVARECGMEKAEVLDKCVRLGVPIHRGRIDVYLFKLSMAEAAALDDQREAPEGGKL